MKIILLLAALFALIITIWSMIFGDISAQVLEKLTSAGGLVLLIVAGFLFIFWIIKKIRD